MSGASTGLRPLCFVLMPFGTKDDPTLGEIHFDAVYGEVIRPAVEAAGMQCVRADEERVGGIIHRPMFERLLLCDYAVADLSLANANVYYELGVRHATRPWSTVLLFREGFRLPFDVGPLRAQPYRLGADGRPARDRVEHDGAALTASLLAARHRTTDSPLFQLLPELRPTDTGVLGSELFRGRVEATRILQGRLADARRELDLPGMRAVRADLGDLDDREAGLVVDLLRSFLAVEAYDDAVALVDAMPPVVGGTPVVREQLAFALNRLGRRDEAEEVLVRLVEERGTDSETSGLLGRVYKDKWADALEQGRDRLAAGLIDRAIAAYLAGFEADWRDHYPGINAVQLMYLRDPTDPRIAELLPVVRYGARQKARRRQADYWDHATLLEVAVLDDSVEEAETALMHALAADPLPWQARSTLTTLVRLRTARESTGPTPDWLRTVETELATVADPGVE